MNGTYQYFADPNTTTILNVTYTNGQPGVIPMPLFIILMGTALILLILAFKEPIRNEAGNISVSKVGLSLCGTIMSTIAALASFGIVDNMGSAVAMSGTYTASVSQYIIWFSPYVTGAMIISGVLCFVMFVYTIIQPESVKPAKEEYKSHAADGGVEKK